MAAPTKFYGGGKNVTINPAKKFENVVPSDTVYLSYITRRLHVITGGTLSLVQLDGTAIAYPEVPDNTMIEGCFTRVNSTGTTATHIVAYY